MNREAGKQDCYGSWAQRCAQLFTPSRAALIVFLALCLILATSTLYRMSLKSDVGLVRFIINGDTLILDDEAQTQLRSDLETYLANLEHHLDEQMLSWQEGALADIEARFQGSSEQYLDWYFSLTGSYTRLGVAVLGDLEPWIEAQLEQRIVEASQLRPSINALVEGYSARLQQAERAWENETLFTLHERFHVQSVTVSDAGLSQVKTINLDQLIQNVIQGQRLDLNLRTTYEGAGTAVGATGVLVARRLATTPAMQAGRAAITQLGTRLGAHATRSAVIGGVTAGASGPAAPIAAPIIIGSTLAVAAGTEFAALKGQELLQRPQMEEEFLNVWEDIELDINQQLQARKEAYVEAMRTRFLMEEAQAIEASDLPRTYRILG